MSNHDSSPNRGETPRYEAWLGVVASSMLPPVAAFFTPASLQLPLFVLTGLLFFTGLAMLWRGQKRAEAVRADSSARDSTTRR